MIGLVNAAGTTTAARDQGARRTEAERHEQAPDAAPQHRPELDRATLSTRAVSAAELDEQEERVPARPDPRSPPPEPPPAPRDEPQSVGRYLNLIG